MSVIFQFLFVAGFSLSTSSPSPVDPAGETSARIVNGYKVDITEVPYQVSLRRRVTSGWSHMCGAVIVKQRAILTAAHCVDSFVLEPSQLEVTVGSAMRTSGGKSYGISKVYVHEGYDYSTLMNDIALLATTSTITFDKSVQPIATAPAGLKLTPGAEAIVSGYGTTSYQGSSSSVLLAAKVNIIEQSVCSRSYLAISTITSRMLCAGASNPPRDACQGDSGGPLVTDNYLIGIVSWGEGCADSMYPGVYTRVSSYSNWIQNKIAKVNRNSLDKK